MEVDWKTEKPKEPGWYYVYDSLLEYAEVDLLQVVQLSYGLAVSYSGEPVEGCLYTHWAKANLPEPPKLMKVPFLDLARVNNRYTEAWQKELKNIIDSSQFINGDRVTKFEQEFAAFAGCKYAIGVSSGLDALTLLLRAKFRPGTAIAVPDMTFAATIEAVIHAGMKPVICEVNKKGLLELRGDEDIDAALPVYLYGKYFPWHFIQYVGDACQAHGAVMAPGELCAYSFYPGKNLGGLGDGGIITVDQDWLADDIKVLREHGQRSKYNHVEVGYTARLDALQATFLSYKLKDLRQDNEQRIQLAGNYYDAFKEMGLETQCDDSDWDGSHVFHLFVVLTKEREDLAKFLASKGISTGLHYPKTLAEAPCYQKYAIKGMNYYYSNKYAKQGLSLPLFPGMTDSEQGYVIDNIKEFFR